jgi:2-C-methyl-D-erythritol 2,4-cyclodiphosphate synthase
VAEVRVGLGFDVHPAQVGRPLRLGGVQFDDAPGLAGHSDADVLCHALGDAMLGAAGLGDLGTHFPDTDPTIEGIGGLDVLGQVGAKIAEAGFRAASCDVTVIAERPAIGPARDRIRGNIAEVLGIPSERVSVKATRPEGLGLAGDGVGCIAIAVLDSA